MSTTLLSQTPIATPAAAGARPSPRAARWAGRALTGVAVLLLAADTAGKLAGARAAADATAQLGFRPEHVLALGLVELACLALYLVPRTAVLGAVLWTGYLGGAVATHLRLGNPLATHVLFPVYVGALLWGGLALRDARVRALVDAR